MSKKRKIIMVKKWIDRGHLSGDCKDSDDIIHEAGRAMDKSCAHEIIGSPLFQATDGKHYIVEIIAKIFTANKRYAKERMDEIEEEQPAERRHLDGSATTKS